MKGWDLTLFNGHVRFLLLGRECGDFHPQAEGANERARLVVDGMLKAHGCIRPSLAHTEHVECDQHTNMQWFHDWLGVPSVTADGFVTERREEAIMLSVADCVTGLLYNHLNHRLCMIHMSLANLVPKHAVLSILENAVEAMRCAYRDEISFWWGGGIGPCCYGRSNDQELLDHIGSRFGLAAVTGGVARGLRKGWPAINLNTIIERQAQVLGIRLERSMQTFECTSCAGTPEDEIGVGTFWSHARGSRERNGAFAMILP